MYKLYEVILGMKLFILESKNREILEYISKNLGGNFIIEKVSTSDKNSVKR